MPEYLHCTGCRKREAELVETRREVAAYRERVEKLDPEVRALRLRVQGLLLALKRKNNP